MFVRSFVRELVNISEAWERRRDQRRSSAAGARATRSRTYIRISMHTARRLYKRREKYLGRMSLALQATGGGLRPTSVSSVVIILYRLCMFCVK